MQTEKEFDGHSPWKSLSYFAKDKLKVDKTGRVQKDKLAYTGEMRKGIKKHS